MHRIAVGQLRSGGNPSENLATCLRLMTRAAQGNAKMLFLPEATDYIAESKDMALSLAQTLDGDFVKGLQSQAKKDSLWISVCVHEKIEAEPRIFNTHLVIDSNGSIVGRYHKLHLFDVNIENGPRLMESDGVKAGQQFCEPLDTPVGKLALSTCYDLRFPELSLLMRSKGAQILTYPSAFTVKTGQAHWEVLLRARAIETQCFVVASAQSGAHNAKRTSYGHSMVVDPWGTVIAHCIEPEELVFADLNFADLERIRREMPVWTHRRTDVYGSFLPTVAQQ